jgi:hydroxyacylglutathione hydrolase
MMLERIFTPGLAQVAYLVADDSTGEAALIDPRSDIDGYLKRLDDCGLRLVAVLETHVHADFVSGARELNDATGATICAPVPSTDGDTDRRRLLGDGDEVAIGQLCLRALWTPGHTPEHLAYLLRDPCNGSTPVALFSGDALFVGEVGRPDLLESEQTRALAASLYRTVVDRLVRLPDDLIVYPGHTAGSACGKRIGDAPSTTIGDERLLNYAFQARSEESFVEMVLNGMPAPSSYYPIVKQINAGGPPLLRDLRAGMPLGPSDIAAHQAMGALVIDSRSPAAFGAGHIPSAVFAGLGPTFTAWVGWLAPYERNLVLVLDRDDRFDEASTELRRIGLDRVAGYLAGGMTAWLAAGQPVDTLAQISVEDLAHDLAGPSGALTVLDVRSGDEWNDRRISGAVHHFAGSIAQGVNPPIDPAARIAVICGSGYRSSVAASLLADRGYRHLINVKGGITARRAADLPVAAGAAGR